MPDDSPLPSFPLPSDVDDLGPKEPAHVASMDDFYSSEDEKRNPTPPTVDNDSTEPPLEDQLTDPVAPEITAPTLDTIPPPTPSPEPVSIPIPPPPPPPVEVPAALPLSSKPTGGGNLLLVPLLIVAVVSATGAFFFYQQTQKLQTQLADISAIVDKQKFTTPSPTPTAVTPTPTAIVTIALTPTPTASPSTPTALTKVFANISDILNLGAQSYSQQQLILITADNANNPDKTTIKYWFRQDSKSKKYFYITVSPSTNPQLVDQQVYVTPDDNIPSMNELATSGKMGMDLDETLKLANSLCNKPSICTSSPTKAQIIRTSSGNIWQVSYTVSGQTKPMVIQIDSNSQKILYQSPNFFTSK